MARAGGKQRITLNSADRIYAELRDRSFAAVGPELRKRAMAIQSDYKTSKVAYLPAFLAAMLQHAAPPCHCYAPWSKCAPASPVHCAQNLSDRADDFRHSCGWEK